MSDLRIVDDPEIPDIIQIEIIIHLNEDNPRSDLNSYQIEAMVAEVRKAVDAFETKIRAIDEKYRSIQVDNTC
jgi:hypothetical protein